MTDRGREKAFGVAAVVTEIIGWIVLIHGSHVIFGVALILAGGLLWIGVPAVADTRPGRGVISLGLQGIRERVQSWDSRGNERPDNNQMQRTGPSKTEPRR
jgi:hypothetical protein